MAALQLRRCLEMGSEELEREEDIEKATATTFERLHLLAQKGYRPDFAMEFTESIWLHHPSKNFQHKDLILYPSGLVVSLSDDKCRFSRDEQRHFQEFLRQVPRPTLMDRSRNFRTNVVAVAILMVVLLIVVPLIVGTVFDVFR